jgi:hypothetical protein
VPYILALSAVLILGRSNLKEVPYFTEFRLDSLFIDGFEPPLVNALARAFLTPNEVNFLTFLSGRRMGVVPSGSALDVKCLFLGELSDTVSKFGCNLSVEISFKREAYGSFGCESNSLLGELLKIVLLLF